MLSVLVNPNVALAMLFGWDLVTVLIVSLAERHAVHNLRVGRISGLEALVERLRALYRSFRADADREFRVVDGPAEDRRSVGHRGAGGTHPQICGHRNSEPHRRAAPTAPARRGLSR